MPEDRDSLRDLLEELPLGVLELSDAGDIVAPNANARVLLDGMGGASIRAVLPRLLVRARETHACVQARVQLGPAGEVRLWVARGPGQNHVVVLERNAVAELRTEVAVLRTLLAAATSVTAPHEAMGRSLESLASALPGCFLVLYVREGETARVLAQARVPAKFREALAPLNLAPASSMVAQAILSVRPVLAPTATQTPLSALGGPELLGGMSAMAFPVRAGTGAVGALYFCGPQGAASEGVLRLVQGLADGLGPLFQQSRVEVALELERQSRQALESETSRAREVATQQERLATLGQLVAGVAHEINNPLAFLKSNLGSISGYVDDLHKPHVPRVGKVSQDEAAAELKDIVNESLEGVARIVELVQALKGTARQRPSEKIPFDPGRAVQEAVLIFRGAKRSECRVEFAFGPVGEVMGSPSALGQVVLNLLQNGLDAMNGRGSLRVEGEQNDGRVLIRVQDSGTGIPEEIQGQIFDPFFTTKEQGKGTGLGLYLCKQIVTELGGDIRFTTSEKGTVFTIDLPIANPVVESQ